MRYIISLLIFLPFFSFAQLGGRTGYSFLEVPAAARQAAVGGYNVSIQDRDVAMGY